MKTERNVEVFSAGCPVCDDTLALIRKMACGSCKVTVLDTRDARVAARARDLGVRSVPAVVIDGRLADCCAGRGPDEQTLGAAGIGTPL